MHLNDLKKTWFVHDGFVKLAGQVQNGGENRVLHVSGLDGGASSFLAAALTDYCSLPGLIICSNNIRADKYYSDLVSFLNPDKVSLLPPREIYSSGEIIARSSETSRQRLETLAKMHCDPNRITIATVQAVLAKCIPPAQWDSITISLNIGERYDREALISQFSDLGYDRVSLVEQAGQFSARGDIIDIFPVNRMSPLRLELFDVLVESIRIFDPESQRSLDHADNIQILPAYELILPYAVYDKGVKEIKTALQNALAELGLRGENEAAARLERNVANHLALLGQPGGLERLYSYFPFFYEKGAPVLDYLGKEALVFLDEPDMLRETALVESGELNDYITSAVIQGDILPPREQLFCKYEEIAGNHGLPVIELSQFAGGAEHPGAADHFSFSHKLAPYYHGRLELAAADLQSWAAKGYEVYLSSASQERSSELLKLICENDGLESRVNVSDFAAYSECPAAPVEGTLSEGFVLPDMNLVLLTESNIFPRRRKKRPLSRKSGSPVGDYRELKPGDFIVHDTHGIGRYQGIVTLEVNKASRDYLFLKYRGTDKLYVPADQAYMIRKYSGSEAKAPRLNSLGGGEWQRVKAKVKKSVEELAGELLSLYAARKAVEGHAYGPDHPWQGEFEANFLYEETPDQLKAIEDVKADMEKPYPMDRLICGDVGYGKTEVALRAAFKAAMEGKQTVIMVPTTILARQHYQTFTERFAEFPVTVAQLSRFVSPAARKKTLADLAAGKIDIIIGTHRLLSTDVRFFDLGLLIIDEEHRFGVRHKEKIRTLRLEVDTLAMTATPIPRTLHLSLAGARDLSIIDTPPENRYPVQTYVLEYSDTVIMEAIRRELDRGGQVYYVYNRVQSIDRFAENLQRFFPETSVAVGHGRLSEAPLEKVMIDFQEGHHSILVSTTIIEAGLDIPNVNTLIVYDADKFGLAQLYQLRGRVGRSDRLAYAYLTYRKNKILSEIARKRLRAIKEFTELGSGFKIALRDLEIRGAGNILGAEQHGFITAVGFNLYCRLLEQAVAALKNEKTPELTDPRLELQIDAYIPETYMPGQDQKVDFYQRIYASSSESELAEICEELLDRFGAVPEPVKNLLFAAELRILARELSIDSIQQLNGILTICFSRPVNQGALTTAFMEKAKGLRIIRQEPELLKLTVDKSGEGYPEALKNILAVLKEVLEDTPVHSLGRSPK